MNGNIQEHILDALRNNYRYLKEIMIYLDQKGFLDSRQQVVAYLSKMVRVKHIYKSRRNGKTIYSISPIE